MPPIRALSRYDVLLPIVWRHRGAFLARIDYDTWCKPRLEHRQGKRSLGMRGQRGVAARRCPDHTPPEDGGARRP